MKNISLFLFLVILHSLITAQNLNFEQYIVPNDQGLLRFGADISTQGSFLIIGSMYNSTDENNNNKIDYAGAAYVYTLENSQWNFRQKIVASDRTINNYFGVSVIATIQNNQCELLIGADEANVDTITKAGKVYYFVNFQDSWVEKQIISPSDVKVDDRIGSSISRSGDYLFIESSLHDYDEQGKNYIENSGAVYCYQLVSGTWIEKQKIVAFDRSESNESFGRSIAFDGNHLFIGSFNGYDENGTNYISNGGSVYIYTLDNNGIWTFNQKIRSSDVGLNDGFGMHGMDAQGNRVIVGTANGFDENNSNPISGAGSVYIFKKNGNGVWQEEQKIVAKHRIKDGEFGHSVSIDGSNLAVGSPYDQTDASNSNPLTSEGAVYLFSLNTSGNWDFIKKVVANNRRGGSVFGTAIEIENENLLISSERDRAGTQYQNGSAHYFTYSNPVGIATIQNQSQKRTNLYPNPAKSRLFIKSQDKIKLIRIYDQHGRKVIEEFPTSGGIDINDLEPNLYLIEILTSNGIEKEKFMKTY